VALALVQVNNDESISTTPIRAAVLITAHVSQNSLGLSDRLIRLLVVVGMLWVKAAGTRA
jgi:hypothetical protein